MTDYNSKTYWLQAAAEAEIMSWNSRCSADWRELANLYRKMAEGDQAYRELAEAEQQQEPRFVGDK